MSGGDGGGWEEIYNFLRAQLVCAITKYIWMRVILYMAIAAVTSTTSKNWVKIFLSATYKLLYMVQHGEACFIITSIFGTTQRRVKKKTSSVLLARLQAIVCVRMLPHIFSTLLLGFFFAAAANKQKKRFKDYFAIKYT